jgi:integrase
MKLDEIKTIHLVNVINELKKPNARIGGKGDLSAGTIKIIHRIMKNVFNRATEWKLIKNNPMIGVPKPKVEITTEKYYEEEEAQQVIKALYEHAPMHWRLYFIGALVGGFRRGELNALQWKHIDFVRNAISIEDNIALTLQNKAVVGKPKTRGSKAMVDMPAWYMDELLAFKEVWEEEKVKLGERWEGGENKYLFHSGTGKPYFYQHPSKWWKDFIHKMGIRYISLHGLRHTTATLLLEYETDTRVIQERLRHTLHSTTTGLYAHVTKKLSRVTADKFDKLDPRRIFLENSVPNTSPTAKNDDFKPNVH